MKLNVTAWANASAVVVGVIYVVCALLVAIFPDGMKIVATSWFHGMDLSVLWTGAPRSNYVLGLLTAVGGSWLTGWLFTWVYNKFTK